MIGPASLLGPLSPVVMLHPVPAGPGSADPHTYAQLARIGGSLPELTHLLPVPVDLISQLQVSSSVHIFENIQWI